MGGRVGLDSVAGVGSTFWVELPVRTCNAPEGMAPPPAVRLPIGTRVLLVIAHDATREGLADRLTAMGARIEQARTDADGYAHMGRAAAPFDMVFLDSSLPLADTAERLQALRRHVGARVRLITLAPPCAGGDAAHDERDADSVLVRPITHAALAALIARVGRSRHHRVPGAVAANPVRTHVRGHVLLAEDSPLNCQIACAMLKNLGCTVRTAENGAIALELVRREDFDLVLMDCQMPEMDGFEATRRIRELEGAQPQRKPLKIVALTANALAGDREACLAAGMSDYLAKPITGASLHEMLVRHLQEASATVITGVRTRNDSFPAILPSA
jgi:CheY-like chemotaxis protein